MGSQIGEDFLPVGGCVELEKLYTASYDEADSRHDFYLNQWFAAQNLLALGKNYIKQPKGELILKAIEQCCVSGLPIPRWCAKAFYANCKKARKYEIKSWDEVFDRPYPKGTHVSAKIERDQKAWDVWNEVCRIKKETPDVPIDVNLFERVGRPLGLCKTKASDFYYHYKKMYDELTS